MSERPTIGLGVPEAGNGNISLSFRKNFSWTLSGNVFYSACQWGMLIVLAKLGSSGMVGEFALGLAIASPVLMFTNLQLRAVQATDARHHFRFGDYLGIRIAATVIAFFVIIAVALGAGRSRRIALVIMAVGLAKAFESISDLYFGLLQKHERMDRIAKSMMIRGILSLPALAAGVYLTGEVIGGAMAVALVWLSVLIFYDLKSGMLILKNNPEALLPRFSPGKMGELIRLALPLGLVMMLISLNANIPRYFLARSPTMEELGIFAALAYFMVAGRIVTQALGQAALPRLARHYAGGEAKAFRKLLARLLGVGALLGASGLLIAFLFGRRILQIVYRPEYAAHYDVFLWLMAVAALSYPASFLGYAMTGARYFRSQLPLFSAMAAVTALACLILIPVYGMKGAAWAMGLAVLAEMGGALLVVGHALRALDRQIKGGTLP